MKLVKEPRLLTSGLRHAIYYIASYCNAYGLQEGFTHMKMQKLLYYVQGIVVAAERRPLFDEHLFAWEHGPVVGDAWVTMKHHAANLMPIDELELPHEYISSQLSDHQLSCINWILGQHARRTAIELKYQTHDEPPWIEAVERNNGRYGGVITLTSLKRHFSTMLRT